MSAGTRNHHAFRPMTEICEPRELLAVTAVLDGSTLRVTGTTGADDIRVLSQGQNFSVYGVGQSFSTRQVRAIVIEALEGNDSIRLSRPSANAFPVSIFVVCGPGDDTVDAQSFRNQGSSITVDGGEGNDKLTGSAGNDFLVGGEGDDTINGASGSDIINGSNGRDSLTGGSGNDVVYGGNDNDQMNGGSGNDVFYGGSGNDTIRGDLGNDQINGEDGDDVLYASSNNNQLFGGPGNDTLYAGTGIDTLNGGAGENKYFPGSRSRIIRT